VVAQKIHLTMTEPAVEDAAVALASEEARAKAEARRQRILEKSKDRMKTVSGEQSKTPEDGEGMSAAQSSGSSRMAAMRRRRQKKVGEGANEAAPEASCDDAAATELKDESPGVTEKSHQEVPETEAPEVEADAAPEPVKEVPKVEKVAEVENAVEDASERRKYKGVAAVRRQKALEKQKEREALSSSTTPSAIAIKDPVRKKASVNVFPIIMHIVTIVILVAAGFDIGYQQVVHPTVAIHRTLAPQQHGIGLWKALSGTVSTSKDPKDLLTENHADWFSSESPNEFDAQGDDVDEPNIDPLFGLDLDLMTRGDGILFILARGAVACHRALLLLCYLLPLKFLMAILHIPKKLLATPPVIAIISIVVRQTARRVFGAALPIPEKETSKEDVLGMLKNGAMSFVSSTFPTMVGVYDAFTHLRADMFVMMCGVFMGLAWTHHLEGSESTVGTDEL
jgi:hypothetical protein